MSLQVLHHNWIVYSNIQNKIKQDYNAFKFDRKAERNNVEN